MKKIILLLSFILVVSLLSKSFFQKEKIENVRKKHMAYLANHPYNKLVSLSKSERKENGLPPNAYFEQKYLNEINPYTGKSGKKSLLELQRKLNSIELIPVAPGAAVSNPWVERGPDNVGGRTRAVIFDPNDSSNKTVFAGGVSGGLWRNNDITTEDSQWVRVGIPENLAVSSIAVDPNNSQIFYVGTGETYVEGDVNGDGLWKSIDGGNTWFNVFGGVTGPSYFDTETTIIVNSPNDIQGNYIAILATDFGGNLDTSVTGDLVLVEDNTIPTDDACENLVNNSLISGKIAILKRGSCNFDEKVLRVQEAGAIAVIVINNQYGDPIRMGGDDQTITIPAIMTTKNIGETLINSLATNINVTLTNNNDSALNTTVVPGIQHINSIAIRDNNGVSEVYIAVGEAGYTGGVSLGGDTFGVYKSIDGTSFTKLDIPKTENGNEYEPNNIAIASDNSVYVSTNKSYTFNDGGGTILKSIDGINFNKIHEINKGDRTEIALSPTNAGTVYVLVQVDSDSEPVKIYKTTDDFTNTISLPLPVDADFSTPANDFTREQAFYNLLLRVDPDEENVLYVGGIDLFKSIDGGDSWNQISHWTGDYGYDYVHADQHGLAFSSTSSSLMLFSNDGGVYYSNNAGKNIESRNNNYNTVQFYTVGVAPTTTYSGDEYIVAGAQDNGTHLISKATSGINSSVRVESGDGAASMFNTNGIDKYYITNYVYNNKIVLRYADASGSNKIINKESGDTGSKGDFINQEVLDSNLHILYSNYSFNSNYSIRRYADLLGTIKKTELKDDLMDSKPTSLKTSPYTKTATTLFVGLQNGKLLKVDTANVGSGEWSDITGDQFVGSISDIEFGKNEAEILVTMHNYGVNSVWYTDNYGSTWQNKEGDLLDIPVKSILQNPKNSNEVILGTDLGVWSTSNFNALSPSWIRSDNGMSNVPVLDLDLRDDNTIFAATYGRGIFSSKFEFEPTGDTDGDGILNSNDNCPTTANAGQEDADGNGVGDVCQDSDGDGFIDIDNKDNCPIISNSDQKDWNNDGIGDACQDSDGDGFNDDVDNCVTFSNPDQKDSNNNGIGDLCDESYKDSDNISVSTTSETCAGKDGIITINLKQIFGYTITITGQSKNEQQILNIGNTSVAFSDLAPGIYEVCVEVIGKSYKQCYSVNVAEAEKVALQLAKNIDSQDYTINITSGTAPFEVLLNGKVIETYYNSNFDVKIKNQGLLEVKTAKVCEGVFRTAVDGVFLKNNPVEGSIDFVLPLNTPNKLNVIIYSTRGSVILNTQVFKQGNYLSIPFSNQKTGTYLVKLGIENSRSIKVIKK